MYTAFYSLNSKPFQISSDPAFIWLGEKHREALATLKYGIFDNKGLMLLTGGAGTGKTTLIDTLINGLDDDVLYARVPDPRLSLGDFFNVIARAFQIEEDAGTKGEFLTHFRHFLEDAHGQKKKVLLLIDEAQLLTRDLLEEIRLLTNIQKEGANLLNIFFVGQDEFNEILSRTENRAVAQRFALNYHLVPLTKKETGNYILHRLRIAGAKDNLFTREAVAEAYSYSGGVPRRINIICDHCLLTGFVQQKKVIDAATVQKSAHDLRIARYTGKRPVSPSLPVPEPERRIDPEPVEQVIPESEEAPTQVVREEAARSRGKPLLMILVLGVFIIAYTAPHEKLISTLEQMAGGKVSADGTSGLQQGVEKQESAAEGSRGNAVSRVGGSEQVRELSIEEGPAGDGRETAVIDEKSVESAKTAPETASEQHVADQPSGAADQPAVDLEGEKPGGAAEGRAAVPGELPVGSGTESQGIAAVQEPSTVERKEESEGTLTPAPVEVRAASKERKAASDFPAKTVMVRFEQGSSDFYFSDLEHIEQFVAVVNSHPDAVLVISGHTDSKGSEAYNRRLSLFRANMIRSFFLGRGVRPYQLKVQGFGSTKPLSSNDTAEGRKANRRVEIDVLR